MCEGQVFALLTECIFESEVSLSNSLVADLTFCGKKCADFVTVYSLTCQTFIL